MRGFIIFFIFVCTMCNSAYSQRWGRINRKIASAQLRVDYPQYIGIERIRKNNIKIFNEVRRRLHLFEKMDIDTRNDTIFVLDRHGMEGSLSFVFWTNKGETLFVQIPSNDLDKLSAKIDSIVKCGVEVYRDGMINQCIKIPASKWDIATIRWWEEHGSEFVQETTLYLTRIIFREHKRNLYDCIRFRYYSCH